MKLIAKGIQFTLTGTLNPAGEAAYQELLKLGKSVSFSGKTQLLIHEQGYSAKPEKAAAKGIPVINEAQLIELVEKGELDLSSPLDADAGEASMDELIGEVRAVISTPSDIRTWERLCEIMETCQPAHQSQLVDYINGHISRWDIEDQLLCVAPHAWLLQMIDGQNLKKFGIVRKLDFFGQKHTGTKIVKALQSNTLTHLLSLNAHVNKDLSKTLMKSLHTLPSCEDLVELGFGAVSTPIAEALVKGDGLKHVTRFIYCDNSVYHDYNNHFADCEHLRKFPFMPNLRGLAVERSKMYRLIEKKVVDLNGIERVDFSRLEYLETEQINHVLIITQPSHVVFGAHGAYQWRELTPIKYPESVKEISIQGTIRHVESASERADLLSNLALIPRPEGIPVTVRGYSHDAILSAIA